MRQVIFVKRPFRLVTEDGWLRVKKGSVNTPVVSVKKGQGCNMLFAPRADDIASSSISLELHNGWILAFYNDDSWIGGHTTAKLARTRRKTWDGAIVGGAR